MNSEIVFNKDSETGVYVMKVYKADVSTLWNYFTKPELIDQWWAPKPCLLYTSPSPRDRG
mgnify:CR=1 FL=1